MWRRRKSHRTSCGEVNCARDLFDRIAAAKVDYVWWCLSEFAALREEEEHITMLAHKI